MGESILTRPMEMLRDLVAASSNWQTWTKTESAAAAEAFVYLTAKGSVSRPHVMIMHGNEWGLDLVGEPETYRGRGRLRMRFEEAVGNLTESTVEETIIHAFLEKIGNVIDDMMTLQGSASGYLAIQGIRQKGEIRRTRPEQSSGYGDYVMMEFDVEW